ALSICGIRAESRGQRAESPSPRPQPSALSPQPSAPSPQPESSGDRAATRGEAVPAETPPVAAPQEPRSARPVVREVAAPTPVPPGAEAAPAAEVVRLVCSGADCGKGLTKGQHDVSMRAYGQPLCPACQKEKSRAGAS